MKTTEEVLEILREFKRTQGEKYGIEQIGLFGSFARGEQNENSDIDVCMTYRKAIDFFILQDINESLEHIFNQKVDLLTLHRNMRPYFRQKLDNDAIYV